MPYNESSPKDNTQSEINALRRQEDILSAELTNLSPIDSDPKVYANKFRQLEQIRNQIARLINNIPSAGPSISTQYGPNFKDPQERKPWFKRR